ncbi:hypothetical protein CBR_g16058 [Chara braunii]|uniref:Uncharacterized protein n=1 Tax=Chara braunii TaxID=69332 RepID=A0A388JT08_CHABU|nr:hypothetical protein CBR_g16058 [Chara braunii]|eukprot:GBG60936.1 hypothetical protein CBR_g16058 [Chara braunii]
MMLRCTFCNKVFQGTQFQATRHFTQTKYCKDVSDEALYEIAQKTQQKFEVDQMERVAKYAAERGLDVPDTGGARGGEAGRRPVEGGVGGDGGYGAPDHPLGGGGGDTEEGVIDLDREACGLGEEGVPEQEDVSEFYLGTAERMEDWLRRPGKGPATEGSSKRKEGGTNPAATPVGKRLRQQKVTEVYGGEWVARHKKAFLCWLYSSGVSFNAFRNQAWKAYEQLLLEQPGSSLRAVPARLRRDKGMLDCQAGLEVELVCTGTRRGMMEEGIARQVALITRDPIGASAPPFADAVFGRRACIFRPYPREDDSDEEPVPEAVDDPALRIPHEIDETHDEMLGGEEEFWGPFGEVASTDGTEARATTPTPTRRESSMAPPCAASPAPPSPVSPLQPAMATADTEELASSLPQHGLLHRGGAVRQLRLRSPFPGILQEEGAPSAAAVEGGMAPAAVAEATVAAVVDEIAAAVLEEVAPSVVEEEAPAAGGAATVEGEVAAAGGAAGGAATVEVEGAAAVEEEEAPIAAAVEGGVAGPVEEEITAQVEVPRGGGDERFMQQFLTEELDPVIAGMTPGVARGSGISDSEMGNHLDFDLWMGLPPSCGWATSTDRAPSRDEAARQTLTQTPRERTTTESPDAARDIMERERARLMASSNLRAQAFAQALEEVRRRETGGDGVQGGVVVGEDVVEGVAAKAGGDGVQGGVVAGEDVAEGVAAEADNEAMSGGPQTAKVVVEGRPQAVDEVVQAGQRHFAPQEVRRPLDAEELAREAVRDVTRLDRRIFDQRLEHPPWQAIPSVPWGPASPVWSGSTSTGGRTVGDVPGVSGGVMETAPQGGTALGESSGAEGLGMPRGSRREQTVAEASARVVVLRKGGGPVTIEEDDPDTDAAVREEDEDYDGEEEGEEESKSGFDGDDHDDEPPPRPPTSASTRSAVRTSSFARGRRRSTSDTRGGTRR